MGLLDEEKPRGCFQWFGNRARWFVVAEHELSVRYLLTCLAIFLNLELS